MGVIAPRRNCGYDWNNNWVCSNSSWNNWGRWVAFAVIVGCAFIIFFLFTCYNARRRRGRGLRPHPGTAWMAGPPPAYTQQPPPQHGSSQQPYYNADPYYQQQAPPQYSPPPPQNYGYFGGQQQGIELQPPQNAYQTSGDRVYPSPMGPPPNNGKG
ncbi:hypothetical protein FE257_009325 [Aspergillus nanangensis]|uniref:Chitin synthesis regulation, resistance to congo red-domain-containing protein n=1 Tax=Aspergillus nanangensis TaxID=2582783 RepID=A0AAD4CK85_ASPNN|nr:hypothetical protein FE257_009325 [Aspergillus nanangensis]